jgi:hypothetical protein
MKFKHNRYCKDAVFDIRWDGDVLEIDIYEPVTADRLNQTGPMDTPWGDAPLVKIATSKASMDELRSRGLFFDRSTVKTSKRINEWVSVTQTTLTSRQNVRDWFHSTRQPDDIAYGRIFLWIPFEDSTNDELTLYSVAGREEWPNLWNGEPVLTDVTPMREAALEVMPSLSIDGPSSITAGGTEEFTVSLVDVNGDLIERDVTVYLESVTGYLPLTRIQLINGIGSAKVAALALSEGDVVRVKAGFKNWKGEADITLEVI